MNIVVFGAGSLGTLLGGMLARTHDVTLVGRDPHMQTTGERGLRVTGELGFEVSPDARTTVPDSANLAVVTVKAFDTEQAGEALADCDLDACLSLQNGLGNEEILFEHLDCPILAGTCTYGAVLDEPGHVVCKGVGRVVLGAREGGASPVANAAGTAFEDAGIVTQVSKTMPRRLWEKLAVNAGINATTALAQVENGALLEGPAGVPAREAARETARVARAHGVNLSDADAVAAVERVAEATRKNTSSMLQDVLEGRQTEIEAINGYVVREASEPVPVNETLASLLLALD